MARGSYKRLSFTLIELLVVVAIIGVLASLLLPAIGRARRSAQKTASLNNIRQIGLCVRMYLDDYNDMTMPFYSCTPANSYWPVTLLTLGYLRDPQVFLRPGQDMSLVTHANGSLSGVPESVQRGYCYTNRAPDGRLVYISYWLSTGNNFPFAQNCSTNFWPVGRLSSPERMVGLTEGFSHGNLKKWNYLWNHRGGYTGDIQVLWMDLHVSTQPLTSIWANGYWYGNANAGLDF